MSKTTQQVHIDVFYGGRPAHDSERRAVSYIRAELERPQVGIWIAAKRDLVAEGTFTYALGKKTFGSKFDIKLFFSRQMPGETLRTDWVNASVT